MSVVEINRAEMREIDNIIRKKYSDFIVDTQVQITAHAHYHYLVTITPRP